LQSYLAIVTSSSYSPIFYEQADQCLQEIVSGSLPYGDQYNLYYIQQHSCMLLRYIYYDIIT